MKFDEAKFLLEAGRECSRLLETKAAQRSKTLSSGLHNIRTLIRQALAWSDDEPSGGSTDD